MKEFVISEAKAETAVLVGLITQQQDEAKTKEYLDELEFLADTAGAVTVKRFTQKVQGPSQVTYVGKGKLEEIKQYNQRYDQFLFQTVYQDDDTVDDHQHTRYDQDDVQRILLEDDQQDTYDDVDDTDDYGVKPSLLSFVDRLHSITGRCYISLYKIVTI